VDFFGFFGFLIVPLIGGFILYLIIRSAVFGGMRDFEKWKRKQDGDQYDQYDQQA
jgi:hypothetical protein